MPNLPDIDSWLCLYKVYITEAHYSFFFSATKINTRFLPITAAAAARSKQRSKSNLINNLWGASSGGTLSHADESLEWITHVRWKKNIHFWRMLTPIVKRRSARGLPSPPLLSPQVSRSDRSGPSQDSRGDGEKEKTLESHFNCSRVVRAGVFSRYVMYGERSVRRLRHPGGGGFSLPAAT